MRRLSLIHIFRRPSRRTGTLTGRRDSAQTRAVSSHDVDARFLDLLKARGTAASWRCVAVGRKREPMAVGRPTRAEIAARAARKIAQVVALQIEYPDICGSSAARRNESHFPAVWREYRLIVKGQIVR